MNEQPTVHEYRHLIQSLEEPMKTMALAMYEVFGEDFEKAPASNRYHSNFPGGLLVHTVSTMRTAQDLYPRFKKMCKKRGKKITFTLDDALFVLSIHDMGKPRSQNIKPYQDHIIHVGNMIQELKLDMSKKHAQAIYYHHGGYGHPICKNPGMLTLFVYICDHWSSLFFEVIV